MVDNWKGFGFRDLCEFWAAAAAADDAAAAAAANGLCSISAPPSSQE